MMRKNLLLVVLLLVSSFSPLPAQGQSTCIVDRLTDTGEGQDLQGDLRFCIGQAVSGADTIVFDVTGSIDLTGPLPDLLVDVAIVGPGPSLLSVRRSTGGNYRIFTVGSGVTVSISGLTLLQGLPLLGSTGGAILNQGSLSLTNCAVTASSAFHGGGIDNQGTLVVRRSTIMGNAAVSEADDSTGGGIRNLGDLTVDSSTIAQNSADTRELDRFTRGGGIFNDSTGTATVTNSTVSGNSIAVGGGFLLGAGIHNQGVFSLSNSTVTLNNIISPGGSGAGISSNGTLNLGNTIVAGNLAEGVVVQGNILGNFTSSGPNLIDVEALLGPLDDNGGPTLTHALLPGSPAIDAGDASDAPEFDQRGFPRIVNGIIDIGAYEVQEGEASPARK